MLKGLSTARIFLEGCDENEKILPYIDGNEHMLVPRKKKKYFYIIVGLESREK